MNKDGFDLLPGAGFKWTDILDDFGIPHYTNDSEYDWDKVISFRFINLGDEPWIVVWDSSRTQPTVEEITAVWNELREENNDLEDDG